MRGARTLIISSTEVPVPVPRLMGSQYGSLLLKMWFSADTWPAARSTTWLQRHGGSQSHHSGIHLEPLTCGRRRTRTVGARARVLVW